MLLYEEIKKVCNMINNNESYIPKQKSVVNKFKREWKRIMALSGLYNAMKFTYSPNKIEITNYGLTTSIYIVPPLKFDMLDNVRDMLQENLGCMILFNHSKLSPFINAKFIFNPQDDKTYTVIKQKYPWEIYIGNNYAGEPVLVDVNKYVHIGEYGGTRSGKSVQQSVILTNLIANISPKDVNLYLCQASKSDLILFKNCEHTKAFAQTLEEIWAILNYLVNTEMPRRSKLIEPYRECAKASNYKDYNALKHTEKLIMTYVVFDETSSIFQSQNEETKAIKSEISYFIEEIARAGASLGICLLISLQRPTKENMNTTVKSQCTTSISFRQNNQASSRVAMDDDTVALGLEQREFVYRLASKDVEYAIVPLVKDTDLQEVLKPFKKSHRTLFDDLEKLSHRNGVKKNKESLIEIGTHFKTENEILEENKIKNPNWVEWENPTGKIIIGHVKSSPNTEKPIKNGREKIC